MAGELGRQRGDQQPQKHRASAQLDQALHAVFAGQARQRQVAEDQRAEHRDLQQAVIQRRQRLPADQDHRRLGDPGQQRQAGETDRQGAAQEAAVAQHLAVVAPQVGGGERLALQRGGLRHGFPQAVEGDGRQRRKQHEHALPRCDVDQRRTGQRPQQRGDQRHVSHQGGDFDAHRLFERLLNRGVADRADKAQADALQETHGDELLDGGDQQDRQAGDDKERHPGQHHRATAAAI